MRILLSAYACEPDKGSEPEVGWTWAIGVASRGHDVWVITRSNNQQSIESSSELRRLPNLHFVYFDLPAVIRRLKPWIGVNVYYLLWQVWALPTARALHRKVDFDRAHHVTFVVVRHPSFLRKLGIPYTFGPVSGGERIPYSMLAGTTWRFQIQEAARYLANMLLMRFPPVRHTLSRADRILVTSPETCALLPAEAREKAEIRLAIAAPATANRSSTRLPRIPGTPLRTLFVGRLVELKGVNLAIEAIARARRLGAEVTLSIVGDGPTRATLLSLVRNHELQTVVTFIPWVPREELNQIYSQHHALLFPSLRDSGGMVVLESMQAGLPVICIALGGPGAIVNGECGVAIEASSAEAVTSKMAEAIKQLAQDPKRLNALSAGAVIRAEQFSQRRLLDALNY